MIEPISFLSNVGGSITATVTFSNLVLGLKNCPEEAKTCFSLVRLVHGDIQYAVGLRTAQRAVLAQRPLDAKRIDDILLSAARSLESVGGLVERLNPDAHGGKIPYQKRLRWFLGDSASFALRTRDLQVQHAAVQGEIAWLRMVELVAPLHSVAETKTSFDNFDLWKRDRGDDNRDDRDDRDDGDGRSGDSSSRTETDRRFLEPDPSAARFLHRVPSAQTLVGSIADVNQIQPRDHINQWVQSTQDMDRGYPEDGNHVELEGSSTFAEHLFPEPTWERSEEPSDDLGSFFRAWREGQAERRVSNIDTS